MNINNITYIIPDNGSIRPQYIFFDYIEDTSIEQTSNITENPIDAIRGTSLQDKTVVDLSSVGISGAFSSRNEGVKIKVPGADILFSGTSNRLEDIVAWFERAIDNSTIFTVCKKGILHHNQLLNSLKWDFDDSNSKIGITLSFIEIEVVERAEKSGTATIIIPNKQNTGGSGITSEIKKHSGLKEFTLEMM